MKTFYTTVVCMTSLILCSFTKEEPNGVPKESADGANINQETTEPKPAIRLPWEADAANGHISAIVLGTAELMQGENILVSHQKDGKSTNYSKFRIKVKNIAYWDPKIGFESPREIEVYAAGLGDGGGFKFDNWNNKDRFFLLTIPNVSSLGRFHIAYDLDPPDGPRLFRAMGWRGETTKQDAEK